MMLTCFFGCSAPEEPATDIPSKSEAPVAEATPSPALIPTAVPSPTPLPEDAWALVLVSAAYPLGEELPLKLARFGGRDLDARVLPYMQAMFEAAEADGIHLKLQSAYRSIEYQQGLFENKVERVLKAGTPEEDAEAVAASEVARPGTSEHHTGLAFDIVCTEYRELEPEFEKTDAFRWLRKNAYRYGFALRYPKGKGEITGIIYEPWHWRFVGLTAAAAMQESGECLEEYLGMTK
ncbi:MAG: M15 family metallopeptidase [Clostridia bacterium]|nr:M15 family metallopeptidase [Clostridia bacterium]